MLQCVILSPVGVHQNPTYPSSLQQMRRDSTKPFVIWNADVNKDELDKLQQLLPMMGARSWLIQTALEKFLEAVRHSPRLQKICKDDIQQMLHNEEKVNLKAMNLKIPPALYDEFNNYFPEWGGATWFIRRLVHQTVIYMEKNQIILDQLVEAAVNNMIKAPQGRPSE